MTDTYPAGTPASFTELTLPDNPVSVPPASILAAMAADAAQRAHSVLTAHELVDDDPIVDLVRLLQETGASTATATAAGERAELSTASLNRLRVAYTFGGMDGLRTAHIAHDPDPAVIDSAIEAIRHHHGTAATQPDVCRNALTFNTTGVQIRLSTSGLWYPFSETPNGWAPARGHSADPVAAYRAALAARRNRHT